MTERTLVAAATRPFRALFQSDAKEGILLIFVAIAAMAVANSALGGAYHTLFDSRLAWSPVPKLDSRRSPAPRDAQPEPGAIHRQFIERTDKEEHCGEEKQLALGERKPFERSPSLLQHPLSAPLYFR